jgi:pyrroline-5-carboxylate reductase
MMGKLAIIGGGRMGEAILAGLLAAEAMSPDDIVVAEPDARRRETLSATHGVRCLEDGRDAVADADVVLLAVKPQVIIDVVSALAAAVPPSSLVISIAAGISSARLESLLPAGTAVVRVMPNTPALAREGMSVVSGGQNASAEQVESARALFSAVGKVIVVDERYQAAATAVSGSGPAYVAIFIDALARAGVRHGLTRDVAERLAIQTVRGTAALLDQTGMHPEQLVDGVCSPGGTTIAAVERLEAGGLRSAVADAVEAAVKRTRELDQ